jgi:outer membrane immunogenic protein
MSQMKYALLAAAAVAAVSSTSAMAQEAAPAGFHVEGVLGYDSTKGTIDYEDTAFPADNVKDSASDGSLLYGVNAGYDFPLGTNTIGVEVGAEWTDSKHCEELFGGDALCASLKRNLYAGLKGSTMLAPRTALTAGIGYVNGKAGLSYDDLSTNGVDVADSADRDGFRLKLGLEQALSSNLFAKVEYRYSDYKNYTYTDGTESIDLGFTRHQIVAGLGVRF